MQTNAWKMKQNIYSKELFGNTIIMLCKITAKLPSFSLCDIIVICESSLKLSLNKNHKTNIKGKRRRRVKPHTYMRKKESLCVFYSSEFKS